MFSIQDKISARLLETSDERWGTLLLRVGHGKYEWISEEGHCDDAKCYAMNNLDLPERVISHNISLRLILLVLNL